MLSLICSNSYFRWSFIFYKNWKTNKTEKKIEKENEKTNWIITPWAWEANWPKAESKAIHPRERYIDRRVSPWGSKSRVPVASWWGWSRRPASQKRDQARPEAQEGDEGAEGDGRPRFIDPGAPRRYPPAASTPTRKVLLGPAPGAQRESPLRVTCNRRCAPETRAAPPTPAPVLCWATQSWGPSAVGTASTTTRSATMTAYTSSPSLAMQWVLFFIHFSTTKYPSNFRIQSFVFSLLLLYFDLTAEKEFSF